MSPRKVAEKLRERWGKALYMAPNRPGVSTSASSRMNTSWSTMSRLAVRLSVDSTILHDLAELDSAERLVTLTLAGRHRHIVGNRAHHQHREAVHVEGERRGGIALGKLL